MKVLYDWLKEYVGEEIPPVDALTDLLTFHAFEIDGVTNVGGQQVIDVKILPDRAADCLSHRGIAREISTLLQKPLAHDPFGRAATCIPTTTQLKVTINSPEVCNRFGMALVAGVTVGDSPEWLKNRLQALGQRSINNVVDATNYVMLALGQPIHAYDADTIPSTSTGWHFEVRTAHDGEEITTLSNDTYTLKDPVALIVEHDTQTPLGIAGIKGGKHAEVTMHTKQIILEAANFSSPSIRKSAQLLRLQTDASKRFENGISPLTIPYALTEVVALITRIAGGVCEGYIDIYPNPIRQAPVQVQHAQIEALLGISIDSNSVEKIFDRLGFAYTYTNKEWAVVAPFTRVDILIAEDIIADIGRVYGYEHIAPVAPVILPVTEYNAAHFYSEKIRHALVALGLSEVITSSFRNADSIVLQNALASDKGCVRSALSQNIQEILTRNISSLDLLAIPAVEVFEIGTVFQKNETETDIAEYISFACGVRSKQQGPSPKDDVRVKEIIDTLEAVLGVSLPGSTKEGIFECNLTAVIAHLPRPVGYEAYQEKPIVTYKPFSAYPSITRDIALWVEAGTPIEVLDTLMRKNGGELLVQVTLFDEFTKDGKVSFAFRLVFQSMDRTLTDTEVGVLMESITKEAQNLGFTVR